MKSTRGSLFITYFQSVLVSLTYLYPQALGMNVSPSLASHGCSASQTSPSQAKILPENLLVAYTTNTCDSLENMQKVTQAIEEGVNVVIWSFVSLKVTISPSANDNAVASKIELEASQNIKNLIRYKHILRGMGYKDVIHQAAFGGWNGPHLPAGYSGKELYQAFNDFNSQAQNELSGCDDSETIWDGFDWDLEGHDNLNSPTNEFTIECLEQMGEMSRLAKANGLVVSMAPPESYLDTTTSRFSRSIKLSYPEPWHQDFTYHGANAYAYVLAKWENSIDFIFLQFYESYSHAAYQVNEVGILPSTFLVNYVLNLVKNDERYLVNFEEDVEINLKNQFVNLPLSKLVFGFANGWADGEKALFFSPDELEIAYKSLLSTQHTPRGMGYWVIEEEGNNGVFLTRGLNKILKTRPVLQSEVESKLA